MSRILSTRARTVSHATQEEQINDDFEKRNYIVIVVFKRPFLLWSKQYWIAAGQVIFFTFSPSFIVKNKPFPFVPDNE